MAELRLFVANEFGHTSEIAVAAVTDDGRIKLIFSDDRKKESSTIFVVIGTEDIAQLSAFCQTALALHIAVGLE